MNVRVLVSGFTSNYGGVESFIMNYYRVIKQIDPTFTIDLLAYTSEPAYLGEIEQMGGRVYVVPSIKRWSHRSQLCKFFQEHAEEYDVFWCNKCDLHDIDFLREAKRFGISKRILHAHSSSLNYSGLKKYYFGIQHLRHKKEASQLATDHWACSDWAAKWIFPEQVNCAKKVKFIPNAIPVDKFHFDEEERRRYREKLGVQGTVYGCVGRLGRAKNPMFALETFQQIWEKNPASYLIMVGSGDMEKEVREKAQHLPSGEHILFLGIRRDIPKLLQAFDCCLMPSLLEGFPMVSIEAQAAGLPVFAASDGITPQAKLTDLFHFLPLSIGPKGWANEISKADMKRKNRQKILKDKGFDIFSAAVGLLAEMKNEDCSNFR